MADNILFENNASALLAATIISTDTTIQVAAGFGDLFPSPTGDQYFYCTLEDNSGNIEVVKITGRSGDNLTMDSAADRGQDGTTARGFTLNVTRVELRNTAAVLEEMLQKNGGTMTGDINLNTNNLVDGQLTGSSTKILAGEIVNVPLRNASGVSTNEIAVPTSPGRATAGGSAILVAGDDLVQYLDVAGVITLDSATVGVKIPAGAYFQLEGPTAANYVRFAHDDTDLNITAANTTDINFPTGVVTRFQNTVNLADNSLVRPYIDDYAILHQSLTISGNAATLNYQLGQSAVIDLEAATGTCTLSVTNPPTNDGARYGEFNLKIIQGSTAREINWPTSFKWPGGTAPTLTTTNNAIDCVAGFTIDGGTTWYCTFAQDFS